jgi:hypothetical protein
MEMNISKSKYKWILIAAPTGLVLTVPLYFFASNYFEAKSMSSYLKSSLDNIPSVDYDDIVSVLPSRREYRMKLSNDQEVIVIIPHRKGRRDWVIFGVPAYVFDASSGAFVDSTRDHIDDSRFGNLYLWNR